MNYFLDSKSLALRYASDENFLRFLLWESYFNLDVNHYIIIGRDGLLFHWFTADVIHYFPYEGILRLYLPVRKSNSINAEFFSWLKKALKDLINSAPGDYWK